MTPLPFFPHIKLFFITSPFPELQRRKKVPFYPRPAAAATDAGRLNDFKTKKTLCGRREGGGTRNTKNFDISLFFGGGPFSILMSPVMYLTFLFRELNVCLFFSLSLFLAWVQMSRSLFGKRALFWVVPCLLFSLSLFLCSEMLCSPASNPRIMPPPLFK